MSSIETLREIIEKRGPLRAYRISCAGSVTNSRNKYSATYYGVARYDLRISKSGCIASYCTQKARKISPNTSVVKGIAENMCKEHGGVLIRGIGAIGEEEARDIIEQLTQRVLEAYCEVRNA